jgi:hypothetical protein
MSHFQDRHREKERKRRRRRKKKKCLNYIYRSCLVQSFVYGSIHFKEGSAKQTERWQSYTRVYTYRRYIAIICIYRMYRRDEEANKIVQREALGPAGE